MFSYQGGVSDILIIHMAMYFIITINLFVTDKSIDNQFFKGKKNHFFFTPFGSITEPMMEFIPLKG